ncbi:MAG: peptidoglycan DD-metalloendopeptidase family protein [Rubrivivax sp.]|nr:peptidoglycan DD-metalloendopeptidase family protein [Rubrivivax sp.]
MNNCHKPSGVALNASRAALAALIGLLGAGCASRGTLAPVEQRVPTAVGPAGAVLADSAARASAPPPAASAASAPAVAGPVAPAAPAPAASAPEAVSRVPAEGGVPAGHHMVKAGDTLVRIGLESGQNWRDIARWNGIENPNVLEVGQVLRVTPPPTEAGAATVRPVAPVPRIESRPLDARPAVPSASAVPASPPAPSVPPAAVPVPAPAPAAAVPREGEGDIAWSWPATGPVTVPFDEARSKGLSIAGRAGEPVLAAADGRVVYAGSGLRGYGNLVIVKHNATYLTAYAHNQTLLVKEDQAVRRGQKIAEMGSSDTDRVQLHFEVRRQGKPVDPAKVLPAR